RRTSVQVVLSKILRSIRHSFTGVSARQIRRHHIRFVPVGIVHSRDLEDVFPYVVVIVLAGNFLDDGAQDNVTAVRVLLLCSRFELQGLVCKQWQEIFQSSEAVLWDGFKLRPKEVAYPGLHLEQLADR